MFGASLHIVRPPCFFACDRTRAFVALSCVSFMCEISCNWFLRVWRSWFRLSPCKACRFVAGCRRRFAFHPRHHASSCARFVGPVDALFFCFVLIDFHLVCFSSSNMPLEMVSFPAIAVSPAGSATSFCMQQMAILWLHVNGNRALDPQSDELQLATACMLSALRGDQVSSCCVGISFCNHLFLEPKLLVKGGSYLCLIVPGRL